MSLSKIIYTLFNIAYPNNTTKAPGGWLKKCVPLMQLLPVKDQLGIFGIPKLHISIFASSQEQGGIWNG